MATINVVSKKFGNVRIEDVLILDEELVDGIEISAEHINGDVMNYHTDDLIDNPNKVDDIIESYLI
jgi:hypothetical protein